MISRRLLLATTLAAFPVRAQAEERWRTYRNTRFGTTIEYPARFQPGRPPDNNDGQSFTAPDGATLSVWGSLNIEELDRAALEAQTREWQAGNEIYSYSARGENWFVFSGRRGPDGLFYKRHMLSHRGAIISAFDIGYPEAAKAEYDAIVTRMSRSLRPGRGYQTKGAP